jgi:hypothetical protein
VTAVWKSPSVEERSMPRKTFLPLHEALPRRERSVVEAATGAGAGLWALTPATKIDRARAVRA